MKALPRRSLPSGVLTRDTLRGDADLARSAIERDRALSAIDPGPLAHRLDLEAGPGSRCEGGFVDEARGAVLGCARDGLRAWDLAGGRFIERHSMPGAALPGRRDGLRARGWCWMPDARRLYCGGDDAGEEARGWLRGFSPDSARWGEAWSPAPGFSCPLRLLRGRTEAELLARCGGHLHLVDLRARRLRWTLPAAVASDAWWSPCDPRDGIAVDVRRGLVAHLGRDHELLLSDLASSASIRLEGLSRDDRLWALDIDPEGRRLAALRASGDIVVWDLRTRERLLRICRERSTRWERAFAFDAQGSHILVADERSIHLYDALTGDPRPSIEVCVERIERARGGRQVFVPDLFDRSAAVMVDGVGGLQRVGPSHIQGIAAATLSPDGTRLFALAPTGPLWEFDLAAGTARCVAASPGAGAWRSIEACADGGLQLLATDGTLRTITGSPGAAAPRADARALRVHVEHLPWIGQALSAKLLRAQGGYAEPLATLWLRRDGFAIETEPDAAAPSGWLWTSHLDGVTVGHARGGRLRAVLGDGDPTRAAWLAAVHAPELVCARLIDPHRYARLLAGSAGTAAGATPPRLMAHRER